MVIFSRAAAGARVAVLSVALWLPSRLVAGENVLQVHVGAEGSFFNPPVVVANTNDIVSFSFEGPFHDVTQSSFDKPCQPLPGGFSSGLAGRGANGSAPAPIWNLRITNASQPIWYYCGAQQPIPHCTVGMVGVINPPNSSAFNQYLASAKNLSQPSPMPAPSVILSGQGAFATASPTVTSTPIPTLSSSSSSATTSSAASPTDTAQAAVTHTHSAPKGAIIGGAVGGSIGLIIILILSFFLFRALKRDKHPDTFTANPFIAPHSHHNNQSQDINRSMSQLKIHRERSDPNMLSGGGNYYESAPSTPATPPPALAYSPPPTAYANVIDNAGGIGATRTSPQRRLRPLPPQPSNPALASHTGATNTPAVNINELAREVAALLQPSQAASSNANLADGSFLRMSDEGSTSEFNTSRVLKQWQQTPYSVDRGASPMPPPHYQPNN